MLFAATAHAARLSELVARSPKTHVGASTRISLCCVGLEVKQPPRTHRGNAFSYDESAVESSYAWDRDNRLRSVTPATGNPTGYQYDANGLRSQRVDATGTTRYLLDGASVLEELDGSNATTIKYWNHPQMTDEILGFQQGGQTFYPLQDGLSSIAAISDANGLVVRSNSYDVFGEKTTTGVGPPLAVGFTGREQDSNGLNYNRDRYYSPRTGNWLSPDRAGMIDGPNLYQYVRGNPVSFRDPTGQSLAAVVGSYAFDTTSEAILTNMERATEYADTPEVASVFWEQAAYLVPLMVAAAAVSFRSDCPNPFGKRGSPAHSGYVAQLEQRLNNKGWKTLAGGTEGEIAFLDAAGKKSFPRSCFRAWNTANRNSGWEDDEQRATNRARASQPHAAA